MSEKIGKVLVFGPKEWRWFAKCWGLTKREVEVIRLMCQGWDSRKIAKSLKIKHNTARAHLSNIYKRMGVHSKLDVVMALLERLPNLPK